MMLPDGATRIMDTLNAAGFEAYAVGGCVRDALLGLQPKDYDLCTNAEPQQMLRVFADFRVIPTGIEHGTVTVMLGHQAYEVTTYRVDGDYSDHRRPDQVHFVGDLRRDLARRDFTINAMAYNKATGVVDAFGGKQDLAARQVRCVGDAHERFGEDALRILRAMRFASVYAFTVEPQTAHAAHQLRQSLSHIAKERITTELAKLLCGQWAQRIMEQFGDVIEVVLPFGLNTDGLDAIAPELPLRLAHLLRNTDDIAGALAYLRLDNQTVRAVTELAECKDLSCPTNDVAIKRTLRRLGEQRTGQLYQLKNWDEAPLCRVLKSGACWNINGLAIGGREVMEQGITGKAVGQALEWLLDGVIEQRLENNPQELTEALVQLSSPK